MEKRMVQDPRPVPGQSSSPVPGSHRRKHFHLERGRTVGIFGDRVYEYEANGSQACNVHSLVGNLPADRVSHSPASPPGPPSPPRSEQDQTPGPAPYLAGLLAKLEHDSYGYDSHLRVRAVLVVVVESETGVEDESKKKPGWGLSGPGSWFVCRRP